MPLSSNAPADSEPAFFQYQNQVKVEKRYLMKEALVDWHHKVRRLESSMDMLQLAEAEQRDLASWFNPLKREVTKWEEQSAAIAIPDFEETIGELETKQSSAMSTPDSEYH